MKAIVINEYGSPDVMRLQEIDKPAVKDGEVLVRISAAGLNPHDWRVLRSDPYLVRIFIKGLRKPPRNTVLGSDMAGVVEAVGRDVTRCRPGDEVYAEIGVGGLAEYVSVAAAWVARKPVNLSFQQAAAVPMAAITALHALRDAGRIAPGQTVLINGASGGVGSFAVQIATALGAAEVTGVCSTRNLELVRSIGADHVIDYTKADFTQSGKRYDMLIDTVGNHSLSECRRVLNRGGTFVLVGGLRGGGKLLGPAAQVFKMKLLSPFVSHQRLVTVTAKPNGEDLKFLRELIETDKVMPVIDRTYPLSEAADAIRYLEQGHAAAKWSLPSRTRQQTSAGDPGGLPSCGARSEHGCQPRMSWMS
jgi:NADPH:quinone reductase-like Zn-dependent oxidoreductase